MNYIWDLIEPLFVVGLGVYCYLWKRGRLKLDEQDEERRQKTLGRKRGPVVWDVMTMGLFFCGILMLAMTVGSWLLE